MFLFIDYFLNVFILTYLIKAECINSPTESNTVWINTEYPLFLESSLSEYYAYCHSCGQRWRDYNGDEVQHTDNDCTCIYTIPCLCRDDCTFIKEVK